MRKLAVLIVFLLLCGALATAQLEPKMFEVPNSELFGGYAYEHADLSGSSASTLGIVTQSSTGLKGFALGLSHYLHFLNGNAGFTLEFARVANSSVDPTGIEYVRTRYMAGPTYRLHRYGFFSPSIHVLAGVDRATFTVPSGATTLTFRDTDLAVAGGATLDGNLSRHLAVRLGQFDYVYTGHYGGSQSSFRYIGGIVLRF